MGRHKATTRRSSTAAIRIGRVGALAVALGAAPLIAGSGGVAPVAATE